MGLDIMAYSQLKHVEDHLATGSWCEDEDHISACAYDAFPRSFRGIPVLGQRDGFLVGGCYVVTEKTETVRFRAGSYSGYGQWRDRMALEFQGKPAGPDLDPDGPFYELLWFADNEGCIGPEAAADLLEDFRENASSWTPVWPHSDPYVGFMTACELAADGGLVEFR
jgi:hypothetical protein